jgi:Carbohydrate esterase, sialic acid-specific acetylesterase
MFLLAILSTVMLGFMGTAGAEVRNVYVRAGQSVQAGSTKYPYTQAPADAAVRLYPEFLGYPLGTPKDAPRWLQTVTRDAHDLAPVAFVGNRAGAEINFGRLVHGAYGPSHNTTIAKFVFGSTSLERDWVNSPTVDLLDQLLIFLSQLKRDVEAAGDTMVIRGFFWNQGQADTKYKFDSEAYAQNLEILTEKVCRFARNPKLPVVVTRTYVDMAYVNPPTVEARTIYINTVRDAQRAFAETDRCADWVNMDDLPMQDQFHPVPTRYDLLGWRDWAAYKRIISRPACTPS